MADVNYPTGDVSVTTADDISIDPDAPVDLDNVTLAQLTKRHPDRTRWEPKFSDYRILYRGGDDMLRSCGQLVNTRLTTTLQSQITNALTPQAFSGLRNRRFLWQLEGEPDPVYYALWNRAYYINYLSAILDYFRHWLFSEDPIIRPREGDDPPDWWQPFVENASGNGKSLFDFVRDVFLDVLICRRAGWLIGRYTSIADQGDDDTVVLTPYPAEQIYDWERDSAGELMWVVLGTREMFRQFPNERMLVSTFTYLDRNRWATWQVHRGETYRLKGENDEDGSQGFHKDDELRLVGQGEHGLGKVPFVMIELPEGLWIADKLAAPCTDIFNKQNRLTNAQLMGCIVQPYLKTADATKASVTFGEGFLVKLKPADGVGAADEDFGWKSPDVTPLEFIGKTIAEQRDEIYRIVHQMALAVDSKAIGAIARSGASKIEDRKASEIILAAFGGYVSEALCRTCNMIGEIEGDNTIFTLHGYKNFNVSSLDEEIQIAALAQTMQFKSKTAKVELEKRVLGRLFDYVDEETKDKMETETEEGYEQEEEQNQAMAGMDAQIKQNAVATSDPAFQQQIKAPTAQEAQQKPFKAIVPPKKLGDKDKEQ